MTKFTLWFTPATDGAVSFNMGTYATREAAEAAKPAAFQEIFDQIGTGFGSDEMRDATRRGEFTILEAEE